MNPPWQGCSSLKQIVQSNQVLNLLKELLNLYTHLQVMICLCVPPKAEQLHKSKGSFSTTNEQHNGLDPDKAMTELFPGFFLKKDI